MRPPRIAIIAPLELRGKESYNALSAMRKLIVIAILACALLSSFYDAPFADDARAANVITFEVVGLRNNNGIVGCSLFNSADGFPDKTDKAIKLANGKIADGRAICEFSNVAPGDYAISAFHDENSNGKLEKNFIGMPKEGVGASNDAKASFGPPKF